jgi:hypothetical protein
MTTLVSRDAAFSLPSLCYQRLNADLNAPGAFGVGIALAFDALLLALAPHAAWGWPAADARGPHPPVPPCGAAALPLLPNADWNAGALPDFPLAAQPGADGVVVFCEPTGGPKADLKPVPADVAGSGCCC